MASDNGIVLMLHMFGYFVSSSCFCCFFFLYAAVHLRAKVFRNDYVVAWCFIYIGFEALAKPKHNHKYQFSLHKQSECVRYIASVHTHFVCVCFFFFIAFWMKRTKRKKKKSNVRTAYWLLHILLFLCSSRMLFVGWSIGRSAYPIYYFFYLSIYIQICFLSRCELSMIVWVYCAFARCLK